MEWHSFSFVPSFAVLLDMMEVDVLVLVSEPSVALKVCPSTQVLSNSLFCLLQGVDCTY